jgi:regulatory protein
MFKENSNKKKWSVEEAKKNMEQYCAFQERCHSEVRSKLLENSIYGDVLEDIIVYLIEQNFLNEERFAIQYAGGKFRIKKWGKIKITQALKQKYVSSYCIQEALKQISDEDYMETLMYWIEKKSNLLGDLSLFVKKQKLHDFAISKGFEQYLILDVLKDLKK